MSDFELSKRFWEIHNAEEYVRQQRQKADPIYAKILREIDRPADPKLHTGPVRPPQDSTSRRRGLVDRVFQESMQLVGRGP